MPQHDNGPLLVATAALLLAFFMCAASVLGQDSAGESGSAEGSPQLAERDRLWREAQRLAEGGEIAQAVGAAEQAVKIHRSLAGEVTAEAAAIYAWIGRQWMATGEYANAATAFDARLAIVTALDETPLWELADARFEAANARLLAGLSPEANGKLKRAMRLSGDARQFEQAGRYRDAIAAWVEAYPLFVETVGPEHHETARALNNLAGLYELMGDYARALPLYEGSFVITRKIRGDEHALTATALNNLGSVHHSLGDLAKAMALYRQALAVSRKVLGEQHPDTARCLDNLSVLLADAGEYAAALPLSQEAAAVYRKTLGDDHPRTAGALNNLASLYYSLGDYARALTLYERALKTRLAVLGENHPVTANSLNNVAGLCGALGKFDRALPLHEQALAIQRTILGENHPETTVTLNNLGAIYSLKGEHARALPFLQRALAATIAVNGADHPETATLLNNLAKVHEALGADDEARKLIERALAIQRTALGDNHPHTLITLGNLAGVLQDIGEHARALTLYEQVVAGNTKVLGAAHPDTALAQMSLAGLHFEMGAYREAAALGEQGVAAITPVLGREHPNTTNAQAQLAVAYAAAGETERAATMLLASESGRQEFRRRQFFALNDEGIRLMQLQAPPLVDLLASLPVADLGLETELLETLLANKAVAFEVRNLRRAADRLAEADEDVARLRHELSAAQRSLETLALAPSSEASQDDIARRRAELAGACLGIDELLNRRLAADLGEEPTLAVKESDLRAALGAGGAHIEYFLYTPFVFQAIPLTERWRPVRYAAFVVPAGASQPATFVDLGPAAEIDLLIDRIAALVDEYKGPVGNLVDEALAEEEYRDVAGELFARLFRPLQAALGDARHVSVGPDGRLHEIAFEALANRRGEYLIEAGYQFAYVNSGRDLLRARGELGEGVVVLAGPDYGVGYQQRLASAVALDATDASLAQAGEAPPTVPPVAAGLSRAADTRRGWRDLGEAALAEGREAAAAFAGAATGPVATYVGGQALEEVVKRLSSPRVLVLITHGDYLKNEPAALPRPGPAAPLVTTAIDRSGSRLARIGLGAVEDPFLRSYLVLAGANRIDEVIPDELHVENGWLTAREISQLDLGGTDLVVLSACSSNRGDANNSEAVAGMRSAFLFAGARTIVGSLFEVPNVETRQLLKPFYEGVAAGRGKLAALNTAKLQFIRERREAEGAAHPFFWASFILVGEP